MNLLSIKFQIALYLSETKAMQNLIRNECEIMSAVLQQSEADIGNLAWQSCLILE